MKKVTIVVPIYNSERYLEKCLDSILKQTYQDFEILTVNDGSRDRSLEILEKYKKKYPEKIIVINQENKGVAQTRNESIQRANGEYIMFIDDDDYIDEDYIEKFIIEAEKNNYDIVLGGYRRITEELKVLKTKKLDDVEWSKFIIMAPWAKIYKKNYLIKNNINFLQSNIGEDVFFNLKAMNFSDRIKIIDYVGYNWFYNTKSVSNTIQKNITKLDVYKLLNSSYNMLKNAEILEKKYELIMTYFTRYIIWLLSFSVKGMKFKIISKEYENLFKWLETKFPEYKKNKNITFFKPEGEEKKQRVMQKIFLIANNIHVGKLLVYLYSKI